MNYKNVFHPEKKFVMRRDSLGNWDPDFDVFSNKGFIEGNSWQYSWYVPHDIPGLVDFLGKDLFNSRLEEGFIKSEKHKFAAHVFDRTTGQSAEFYINQGNEVNMCTRSCSTIPVNPGWPRNGRVPSWTVSTAQPLIMVGKATRMKVRWAVGT